MSLTTVHALHKDAIFNEITDAVESSLINRGLSEPYLVARLVKDIPNAINNDIAPLFRQNGCDVSAYGVFVHQQPQVKTNSYPDPTPAAVEIGDLLLIHTNIDARGNTKRFALLLQAKKVSKIPAKPDNKNQLHLYLNWPAFEYVRSPGLNGLRRQISGPNYYSGARYLVLRGQGGSKAFTQLNCANNRTCLSCPGFSAATAKPQTPYLTNHNCFSGDIYGMLFGTEGREFQLPPAQGCIDWDQVIADILNATAHRIRREMGGPRGYGQDVYAYGRTQRSSLGENVLPFINEYGSTDSPPPNRPLIDYERDELPSGMPIIEIVTQEFEQDTTEDDRLRLR